MLNPSSRRKLHQKIITAILCITILVQSSPLPAWPYPRSRTEPDMPTAGVRRAQAAEKTTAGVARQALPTPSSDPASKARSTPPASSGKRAPVAVQAAFRFQPRLQDQPQPEVRPFGPQALPTPLATPANPPAGTDKDSAPFEDTSRFPPLPPGLTWSEMKPQPIPPRLPAPPGVELNIDLDADFALVPGWNLVSIPEEPADTDPAVVLSSVAGNFDLVFAYAACDTADPWKLYDPATPLASDLTAIDHTIGFWIHMTAAGTLNVSGTKPSSTTIRLCEGWNLVGYPWDEALPVRGALSSIEGKYTRVFAWDPTDPADPWQGYDVTVPAWANDLQVMVPGRGYWVLASEVASLVIDEPDPPPTVEITDPIEGGEITTLVDVTGTVNSTITASWTLDYRHKGDLTWTALATGDTSTTNEVQGTFDPTLLLNGIYELRLTATDVFGQSVATQIDVLVDGELKVGLFTISFIDLAVPVSGIPIEIVRTYDSRDKRKHDFGVGWTLDIQRGTYTNNRKPGDGWFIESTGGFFNIPCAYSQETKYHVTEVRFSDVEFYRFALRVAMSGFGSAIGGGCLGTAYFEQIGGLPGANLYILGDDSVFWHNGGDQVYDLAGVNVFEPQEVQLTTANGRQFDLTLDAGLNRIEDLNSNVLTINENGITHSSGKSVSFTRDAQNRITRITDPMGNSLTYSYDVAGDLVSVTDRTGNVTTFAYDADHFLQNIVDPLGNIPLRNEYDANGRLVAQIDADGNRTEISADMAANTTAVTNREGNITQFEYNHAGLVTQATSDGIAIQFTYDDRGNKLTATDPLGNTKSFAYDANDNLISETGPLSNTISYAYDSSGRLTAITDPDGNITSFTHDAKGNLIETRDASGQIIVASTYDASGNPTQVTTLGGTTTFTYDTSGNVIRQQGPSGQDKTFTYDVNGNKVTETVRRTVGGTVVNETTIFTYDANGNVLSITDPLGNVTSFTHDALGQVLTETDARGNITTFVYDERGNLVRKNFCDGTFQAFGYNLENRKTAETDRAGRTTFFEYDIQGNPTRTLYPNATSVVNTYDAAGNRISTTDERGNTTTFEYDPRGRRIRMNDPLGNVTHFAYNANGAMISTTDPLGNVTQFAYDESNFGVQRLIETTFADGTTRQRTYVTSGRIASETDEAGNTTTFEYDAAGSLAGVIDALSNTTTYVYDEVGNHISQTDANGNTTTFEYDANGHMTRRTLPLGMSEMFIYDAVGNKISHTDFNGETTTFEYDCMNRLIRKNLPDGTTVVYTYTPTDQVETITDARGVTHFTYDLRARLIQVENPDGTTLTYTYDATGHRTSVPTIAGTTSYTYDAANRLTTVTDPQGGVTTYTYDTAGNRTSITYPNGTETHYTYDVRNRLTIIEHTSPGGTPTLARYDYTLGPTGNRTRLTESSGRVVNYTYDALFRLTQEVDNLGGTTVTTSYAYDAVGNRLTMDRDGARTSYTYDANDRLLTAGAESFTYDANGNMLSQDTGGAAAEYTYDAANRLVHHAAPDGTTTIFTYDDFGNRVQRDVGGVVTQFIVDPADNSGLPQVLVERDSSGAVTASYIYGDDLISIRQGTVTHYYHYDGVGSTRFLTSSTGGASDNYTYDAFGNIIAATGTTPNAYLFTGEQLDPNLGFYYLRARYVSPQLGRFVSADPFHGSIYDPASLHKYAYAHNDPVNKVDPTGLFTLAGINISISISRILTVIAIGIGIHKELKDIESKLEKLLKEIPGLKLNKDLDRKGLRTRKVTRTRGSLELDPNLGGGAVDQAYSTVAEIVGGTNGEFIVYVWSDAAGLYMSHLPELKRKPAHYLACEFNDYVYHTYELELVNGTATKSLKPALQAIGTYLAYTNFLALMGATVNDLATGQAPKQPAGSSCPLPWSR